MAEGEGEGEVVNSLQSLQLDLPPSCIEFCPAHPEYFLIGTYCLEREEPADAEIIERVNVPRGKDVTVEDTEDEVSDNQASQSRKGSICVFRVENRRFALVLTQSQTSAILDLHFQQLDGRTEICAAASSTGTISIFRFSPKVSQDSVLSCVTCCSVADENVLVTACAWHPTIRDLLVFTTTAGKVYLLKLNDNLEVSARTEIAVLEHTQEAWTAALSPQVANTECGRRFTVYSGGDDSSLRYNSWELETAAPEIDGEDETKSEFVSMHSPVNIDSHDAGVVAILPLHITLSDGAHVVVTGSYDERLRVFAIKPLDETYSRCVFKALGGKGLGGGVWRLKLINVLGQDPWRVRILASCMHAGARIVEIRGGDDGSDWDIEVLARFEQHASMNYGSDFQPSGLSGVRRLTCVSTSFYDKRVCLWEF